MSELPLFPLQTVLFPGGRLQLRVFEKRYMDMVAERLKTQQMFGVCLIRSGHEVGEAAQPHALGSVAHIVDCNAVQTGILDITVRGGRRFRIRGVRVQSDQLIIGDVELLPEEPKTFLAASHSTLAELLGKILNEVGDRYYFPPVKLDDAVWIAYRLAELLPLPSAFKQSLLEQSDVDQRLDMLAATISIGDKANA